MPRWRLHDRGLLGIAALLLAVGLFEPTLPWKRRLFDHVVVFDITQSMNVQDHIALGKPVARLAHAKKALRAVLTQLPCGSRIGLGIFTEYRTFLLFTPVEVCSHLPELGEAIDAIDGRMAWTGNSEVAKGLHSGIAIARQLPDRPTLVFVTDGHEAPPLNPSHRPRFDGTAGEVKGWIAGVGDAVPQPIPKIDPLGRPLGTWGADEVMQTDLRSRGRGGSVGGEAMVDDPGGAGRSSAAVAAMLPAPGTEHLSSLRESYLRLLSSETGLGFMRLKDEAALVAALTDPALARPVPWRADLRLPLCGLALLLLVARHARWRRPRR